MVLLHPGDRTLAFTVSVLLVCVGVLFGVLFAHNDNTVQLASATHISGTAEPICYPATAAGVTLATKHHHRVDLTESGDWYLYGTVPSSSSESVWVMDGVVVGPESTVQFLCAYEANGVPVH